MKKIPRQARAQRTVDFILEAAAYILAERGFDGLTTNRIAERAGVNIASLYQYFPDKRAILQALQQRHIAKPEADQGDWRQRTRGLSLEDLLRFIVEAAIDEHAVNATMHAVFLNELPRRTRKLHDGFEDARLDRIAALLRPVARKNDHPQTMVFIARHALLGVIHEAVCERPHWLRKPEFRDELVRLLCRYLA